MGGGGNPTEFISNKIKYFMRPSMTFEVKLNLIKKCAFYSGTKEELT